MVNKLNVHFDFESEYYMLRSEKFYICVYKLFQLKRKAYIIVMLRLDSNLRKKALCSYTLKCECLNNKTSTTISADGCSFSLVKHVCSGP